MYDVELTSKNDPDRIFELTIEEWDEVVDFTESLVDALLIRDPTDASGLSQAECMVFAAEIEDSMPLEPNRNAELCEFLRSCGGFR